MVAGAISRNLHRKSAGGAGRLAIDVDPETRKPIQPVVACDFGIHVDRTAASGGLRCRFQDCLRVLCVLCGESFGSRRNAVRGRSKTRTPESNIQITTAVLLPSCFLRRAP